MRRIPKLMPRKPRRGSTPPPEHEERPEDYRSLFSDVKNPKQVKFLCAFVHAKSLSEAQRLSRVHRHSHYLWLESDAEYAKYFRRAVRVIADLVEEEAYRRAFVGADVPIYYHGRVIGYYKVYSDKLAMFMLKCLRPEVYGDKREMDLPDDPPGLKIRIRTEGEEWRDLTPGPEFPRYQPESA